MEKWWPEGCHHSSMLLLCRLYIAICLPTIARGTIEFRYPGKEVEEFEVSFKSSTKT
jgi:hypothetical protein